VSAASGWPPISTEGSYDDLESLIRATYKDCGRVAYRLMGQPDDAEEVTQEAYLKLTASWPRVRALPTAGSQYAYLLKIVTNEALQVMRLRQRRPEYLSPDIAESARVCQDVEERALARVDLRPVWQAISALPQACRVVMSLHTAGYVVKEIAAMLGVREGTVRNHLSNARRKLRPAAPGAREGEQA
jgi:RNA polymerase sigma-70 factor (ECF subfamily)